MRFITAAFASFLIFVPLALCQEDHHHALTEEEVGSVHFSTSCRSDLAGSFNGAVAVLHSFQYEQAQQAFAEIAHQDPQCAMAAGRAALERAKQVEAGNPKTTARETAYIAALAEIYREDDKGIAAHAQAFEQKMGGLQAAYPEDDEAAIFHALSLAITAPKTDKTFANQRKCGEILEPIFAKNPHHPGIAHYIIHCYDNPVLAEKGLGAARMYARIAPASAHANHMPSHLFTRVGSWDESINSNIKSAELAAAAEATSKNGEARDQRLHAMDYFNTPICKAGGWVSKAKDVIEEMNSLPALKGLTLTGDYALAAMPARYAIEFGKWEQASQLRPREDSVAWAAIGIGSARSRDLERAGQAKAKLGALRDAIAKQNNSYWSNQVEVERREVAAWIAEKNGKAADALQLARSAAELEESMDKAAVTPGAVTPGREVLADLSLLEHHPKESLAEYENALKIAPNRFAALYGAANAAEEAGDATAAANYFQKLTRVAVGEERSELKTARQRLAQNAVR